MSQFIEMVLNTWIWRPSDKVGEVGVTVIHVEEIRTMIWNPHGRHSSGLLNEAWSDVKSQQVLEHGMPASRVYPAVSCCWGAVPRSSFFYADGQFFCTEKGDPLITIVERDGYPLNFTRDLTPYFDDGDAEREDYDENFY